MLAVLPFAALDSTLIELGPFVNDKRNRSVARLSYPGLDDVSIVTPPLHLLSYDPITARLSFDLSDQRSFATILTAFQERLQSSLGAPLLRLATPPTLTLFAPPSATLQKPDGTLSPLASGGTVRCAVRFHGIYCHANTYRIQHSIVKIWMVAAA